MKTPYKTMDFMLIGISLLLAAPGAIQAPSLQWWPWSTWIFLTFAAIFLIVPLLKKTEGKEWIEFDQQRLTKHTKHGLVESISWQDLHEIGIVTTGEGPFLDDVLWTFANGEQTEECVVSNNAEGFHQLLLHLQRLPGFDNDKVIQAMGSTGGERFVVWQKKSG